MENKKIKEFKDDAAADTSVVSVAPSLAKLASATTNAKDYARVIEAIMKWLKAKKGSQLSSLDSNQNYKMVMNYLNKMQSETVDTKKQSQQPIAQK
jgi:flagellar motor component MotA